MKKKIGKYKKVSKCRARRKIYQQILARRIFKASDENDHKRLKQQLDKAKFADFLNEANESPLNIKCKKIRTKADIRTVKILLRRGANLMRANIDGDTPAKYLLETRDPSLIDLVLLKLSDLQAPLDPEKNTALHISIRAGDGPTVAKLLNFRANPNIKNSEGYTPIHTSLLSLSLHFLKDLMDHGGDIELPGPEFSTPLHMATRLKSLEVLKAVLAFKPKTDVLNSYKLTPLMELVTLNDFPPVNLIYELLEHGADPGFIAGCHTYGYNCLHLLLKRSRVNVQVFNFLVPMFIQYGLDINAVTNDWRRETALHIAIRDSKFPFVLPIVLSLLRYGSDLKTKSCNGMALDIAFYRCDHAILLCVITQIALEGASNIQEYLAAKHAQPYLSEALYLLNRCKQQIETFKSVYVRGSNLSCYDVLTMSTEALSWRLPQHFVLENDCIWTFVVVLNVKIDDGRKLYSAYLSIALFLGHLFKKFLKDVSSIRILCRLIVPYFENHEALKLQRRLRGVQADDWTPQKIREELKNYSYE